MSKTPRGLEERRAADGKFGSGRVQADASTATGRADMLGDSTPFEELPVDHRRGIAKSGPMDQELLEQCLTDEHYMVREAALHRRPKDPAQIERALTDEAWQVRASAITYAHDLDDSQIERGLTDDDKNVRLTALVRPEPDRISDDQLERALTDDDEHARFVAMSGQALQDRMTDEQRDRAFNDLSARIQIIALDNFEPSDAQIETALTGNTVSVRLHAMKVAKKGQLDMRQIERALEDDYPALRKEARRRRRDAKPV